MPLSALSSCAALDRLPEQRKISSQLYESPKFSRTSDCIDQMLIGGERSSVVPQRQPVARLMNDWEIGGTRNSWVCPSDRHLALRARLNAGWSVHTNEPSSTSISTSAGEPIRSPPPTSTMIKDNHAQQSSSGASLDEGGGAKISETERRMIEDVLSRAEQATVREEVRLGRLVERLESLRRRAAGNGSTQCVLCAADFGLLASRSYGAMCTDCRKYVCQKNCGVDVYDTIHRQSIFLCKICAEHREMWKKSNAWFYRRVPNYRTPDTSNSPTHSGSQLHINTASGNEAAGWGASPRHSWVSSTGSCSSRQHPQRGNSSQLQQQQQQQQPGDAESIGTNSGGQVEVNEAAGLQGALTPSSHHGQHRRSVASLASEGSQQQNQHIAPNGAGMDVEQNVADVRGRSESARRTRNRRSPMAQPRWAQGQQVKRPASSHRIGRRNSSSSDEDVYGVAAMTQELALSNKVPYLAPGEAVAALNEQNRQLTAATRTASVCNPPIGHQPPAVAPPLTPSKSLQIAAIAPATAESAVDVTQRQDVAAADLPRSVSRHSALEKSDAAAVRGQHQLRQAASVAPDSRSVDSGVESQSVVRGNSVTSAVGANLSSNDPAPAQTAPTPSPRQTNQTESVPVNQPLTVDAGSGHSVDVGTVPTVQQVDNGTLLMKDRKVKASNSTAAEHQMDTTHVVSEEDLSSFGQVEFSMKYEPEQQTLQVNMLRAKNLRAMDINGFSDPFVKMYLIPGAAKSSQARTRTVHKSLNPEWNEQLIYHGVSPDDLHRRTLRITVLDEDRFGADFLGETRVPLRWLAAENDVTAETSSVVPSERHFNVFLEQQIPVEKQSDADREIDRGKIQLSLGFSSKTQCLNVTVLRCSELAGMDPSGYSDPYVRVQLSPLTDKKHKGKTHVKKRTCNPEYNHEFVFPITLDNLVKKSLEIGVFDRDFGNDDWIGGLVLGDDGKGERVRHWTRCVTNPNQKFACWHRLLPAYNGTVKKSK